MCQADFSCEHSITTEKSAQRHTIEKKSERLGIQRAPIPGKEKGRRQDNMPK